MEEKVIEYIVDDYVTERYDEPGVEYEKYEIIKNENKEALICVTFNRYIIHCKIKYLDLDALLVLNDKETKCHDKNCGCKKYFYGDNNGSLNHMGILYLEEDIDNITKDEYRQKHRRVYNLFEILYELLLYEKHE